MSVSAIFLFLVDVGCPTQLIVSVAVGHPMEWVLLAKNLAVVFLFSDVFLSSEIARFLSCDCQSSLCCCGCHSLLSDHGSLLLVPLVCQSTDSVIDGVSLVIMSHIVTLCDVRSCGTTIDSMHPCSACYVQHARCHLLFSNTTCCALTLTPFRNCCCLP